MIKSRMGWSVHVAYIGKQQKHTKLIWKTYKKGTLGRPGHILEDNNKMDF
jgi:hypothetical protein